MKKPSKDLRKRFFTDYADTTVFSSRARLLQSIWRYEKGFDFAKYGNFIEADFAKNSGSNFLTENILKIVVDEVSNKHKNGKMIQEPRIWNNLLSSQPLAFNLFGELASKTDVATLVFQELYPFRKIKAVTNILFEYSPGRKDPKYTGDSSAFDVFIEYENNDSQKGFLGIEVKYAESLNDKPSTHKKSYETVAKASKIFDLSKIEDLKEKPIQQIWRDHLLALSLFITNDDYDIGDFIYLYPQDNENCKIGIEKYKTTFSDVEDTFYQPLTLETLVKVMKKYCSDNWLIEFQDRYLNFEKIERL